MEKENVILFPKWKKTLEEESLLALKEKRYTEALHKLDQLLSYQIDYHEIVMGKLICLMELDRYEDAEILCEQLLTNKNENYYHYLHIYLTILFQTSQYSRLMERIDHEFENAVVPQPMKEQFQQLYDMSEKMKVEINDEKSTEYINGLHAAMKSQDYAKQWRYVENLRKVNAIPSIETAECLLKENMVHPVIKTAIFKWLQDSGCDKAIIIHKLDMQVEVVPNRINDIESHGTFKQILLLINKMEQNNPSLYQLMEKLLYRYMYVRYPIMPSAEHVEQIAAALTSAGETYLGIENLSNEELDSAVLHRKEEIQFSDKLYLSILED